MKGKTVVVVSAVVVVVALHWLAGSASAGPSGEGPTSQASLSVAGAVASKISYQGRLTDAQGSPQTGSHNLKFEFWDQATGGSKLGERTISGVQVENGLFTVALDVDASWFRGQGLWLAISINGQVLSPRQEVLPVPYALSLRPEAGIKASIYGGPVFWVENTNPDPAGGGYAIAAKNASGNTWRPAIYGENTGASAGVYGRSDGWHATVGWQNGNNAENAGVYGYNGGAGPGVKGIGPTGVFGESSADYGQAVQGHGTGTHTEGVLGTSDGKHGIGVYGIAGGTGEGAVGVRGQSAHGDGVEGWTDTAAKSGVYGHSTYGFGVTGASGNRHGVYAVTGGRYHENAALRAESTNADGGMAAYMTNGSAWPTAEFDQTGTGRVLDLQNNGDADGTGGGDFVAGFSKDVELQFRITSSGQGRSDVGWTTPAEDFAEMLPGAPGLGPGDVLVIGPDGKLVRSTQPYQTAVAGVYSTQPGFLGGQPVEGDALGAVPLAVVGVVPVKASAENGRIRPGDLLVASSTPGHAMGAGPHPPVGSVIGKALQGLEQGIGVIRVLAVLQ